MYIENIAHGMGKKKPIYVATEMNTTMEKLWAYTQEPDIHTEWDARFTEISYLEKKRENHRSFYIKQRSDLDLK